MLAMGMYCCAACISVSPKPLLHHVSQTNVPRLNNIQNNLPLHNRSRDRELERDSRLVKHARHDLLRVEVIEFGEIGRGRCS